MLVTKLRHVTRGGRGGLCRVSTSSFTTLTLQPGLRQPQKSHALTIGGAHYRRNYVAVRQGKPAPKSIAVLGGGLTGLTTAYYITRYLPNAKVTIYEATDRLGGWIDTETVNVTTPDGIEGQVQFERGARSVKAPKRRGEKDLDGLLFCDLLVNLELESGAVRVADRETYVGKYVYYPDHLVPLGLPPLTHFFKRPLNYLSHVAQLIQNLKDEPAFKDLFSSLINWRKTRRPPATEPDVSVGHYLEHRFGSRSLVDNLMSAMIHGIYGGDVWKLSLDSSPLRWRKRRAHLVAEARGQGEKAIPVADVELLKLLSHEKNPVFNMWDKGLTSDDGELTSESRDPEWFWFRNGFSTLTDRLAAKLRKNPNVTIKMSEPVALLAYHSTDGVALRATNDKKTVVYDKVISTLFAGNLAGLIRPGLVPTLKESKAVTIKLVNLWYPTPRLNHPAHGFGYLIPQSVPYEQNPECALGVIFDSDREAGWDFDDSPTSKPGSNRAADTVPGTKFTVMLGGHYWDELPKQMWPSGEEAIEMAKRVLARHLHIPQAETDRAVGSTKTCRQCIPQHFVGHTRRMNKLEGELQSAFRGRLAVIGGSYQLPGVLPSIRAAWDISKQLAQEYDPQVDSSWDDGLELHKVGPTGLGRVGHEMQYICVPKMVWEKN